MECANHGCAACLSPVRADAMFAFAHRTGDTRVVDSQALLALLRRTDKSSGRFCLRCLFGLPRDRVEELHHIFRIHMAPVFEPACLRQSTSPAIASFALVGSSTTNARIDWVAKGKGPDGPVECPCSRVCAGDQTTMTWRERADVIYGTMATTTGEECLFDGLTFYVLVATAGCGASGVPNRFRVCTGCVGSQAGAAPRVRPPTREQARDALPYVCAMYGSVMGALVRGLWKLSQV